MPIFAQIEVDVEMLIRTGGMLLGLACIYYAVRLMRKRRAIRKDPVQVQAKVLSLELEPGGEGPDWYTPTVRYRDENGDVHEAKLMIVRDTDAYAVGRKVPIVYQRGNPTNVIDSQDGWAEPIAHAIIFSVGAVLFLFGAVAAVVAVS